MLQNDDPAFRFDSTRHIDETQRFQLPNATAHTREVSCGERDASFPVQPVQDLVDPSLHPVQSRLARVLVLLPGPSAQKVEGEAVEVGQGRFDPKVGSGRDQRDDGWTAEEVDKHLAFPGQLPPQLRGPVFPSHVGPDDPRYLLPPKSFQPAVQIVKG